MAVPIADLTQLTEVVGQSLFYHLQSNFQQDTIYVYIGDILLALNPFTTIPIYGPQIGQQYCHLRELKDFPPHIYAIAHRLYGHVTFHKQSQCVVLLGESGSGKTESCKMLVSQLIRECDHQAKQNGHLPSQLGSNLVEVLNLVDAFGNASTEFNTNASRFTKTVDVFVDDEGVIVGANINAYHLEKSRISDVMEGEKNFNILYHLIAGLSQTELKYFYIDGEYRIISPVPGEPLYPTEDDFSFHKERFAYIKETIENELKINFQLSRQGVQDIYKVFGVLSALLHVGNVSFHGDRSGGAIIANDHEVEMAASLLNVLPQELSSVFLHTSAYVKGQVVRMRNSVPEAEYQRDKILQTIYSHLFDWLIYCFNTVINPEPRQSQDIRQITIVDSPGFENRHTNSLEQLHFNLLAEKLHQFTYNEIFLREIRDCEREGVRPPVKGAWNDNRSVIDVLDSTGILGILDEISRSKTPTDAAFLERVNKSLGKKSTFVRNKIGNYFTIVHTDATVNYAVADIVNKNLDVASEAIYGILSTSGHPLISTLFSRQSPPGGETRSQQFRSCTNEIIKQLEGKKLHLITCIKPNQADTPNYFEPKSVMKQLEVASVLELIKIRQKGYSVRITQDEFVRRYKFLAFPLTSRIRSVTGACHKIVKECRLPQAALVISNKMVFMQCWHEERLDYLYWREIQNVVTTQAAVRRHKALKHYYYKLDRMRGDREYVHEFSNHVDKQGMKSLHHQREQADHNHNTFQQELRHTYGNLGQYGNIGQDRYLGHSGRESDWGRRHYQRQVGGEEFNTVMSTSLSEDAIFFQNQLERIQERRNKLDPGTWCKLIYLEKNKEIAKFYLTEKEVTIDGSYEEYHGDMISLGIFHNKQRSDIASRIRSRIKEGVTIRKDGNGNIWAFRHCQDEIVTVGYKDPANHCISADVIVCKGRLPFRSQIKIFDLKEFKGHIGMEIQSSMHNTTRLRQLCVTCLSFGVDVNQALDAPVWLCIINIAALEMLESQEVIREVQNHLTQLKLESNVSKELRYEEEELTREIKQRHHRTSWSRTDKTESKSTTNVSPAKLRRELLKKGEKIGNHMNYSWDAPFQNKSKVTVGDLQQGLNNNDLGPQPEPDYDNDYDYDDVFRGNQQSLKPNRINWAKIKVNLKADVAKQETDEAGRQRPNIF